MKQQKKPFQALKNKNTAGCVFVHLQLLSYLSLTLKGLKKNSSVCYVACFLLHCVALLCFFLSLGHWWVFVIVISHALCECSSFLKCWVKLILLFCRVISIFPLFSLSVALASPSLRLSVCLLIHSLFKHGRLLRASWYEVSVHLRRAAFSLQLLPHVGH